MPGQLVTAGPWPGGLNNRDQSFAASLVPPNELRFCKNLEVLDTGGLVNRLGCRLTGGPAAYTDISTGGAFWLLGGVDTTDRRYAIIGSHNGGSPGTTVVRYTTDGMSNLDVSWTVAPGGSLTGLYSTVYQYGGFIYVVGQPGGGVGQRRADITAGAWAAVAAQPAGDLAFVVRERAFIVNKATNRIYWSKATDPTVWAAPDGGFVDVNPGDGSVITDVVVVNSQLYIFKRNRTYVLIFTSDPALDGQVTLLNASIGAYSATVHLNSIYVVNDRSVYRLQSNYFTDVGTKLALPEYGVVDALTAPGIMANVERDVLVIGPMVNTSLTSHFSMNLRTGAWAGRQYSDLATAPSTKQISWRDTSLSGGAGVLYGHGTRNLSGTRLRSAFGDPTACLDVNSFGVTVSPEYSFVTGEFTGGDYGSWKRLHYAAVRLNSVPAPGDAAVLIAPVVGPDLSADAQPRAPVPVQYGGKIALTSYRFRSMAWRMDKPQTTLGALSSNTASYLVIKEVASRVSSHGRGLSST